MALVRPVWPQRKQREPDECPRYVKFITSLGGPSGSSLRSQADVLICRSRSNSAKRFSADGHATKSFRSHRSSFHLSIVFPWDRYTHTVLAAPPVSKTIRAEVKKGRTGYHLHSHVSHLLLVLYSHVHRCSGSSHSLFSYYILRIY